MVQKIFITSNGMIDIKCPKCGKIKEVDVSKYLNLDKALNFKATCGCSHVFPVMIERRRHIRKNINLKGTILYKSKQYPVKILDISRLGMRIITGKSLDILEGERLEVTFMLNDPGKSNVSKEVVVKKKYDNHKGDMGVAFLSHEHYDDFGKYLLFYFQ
ncbi:MAG: PilZ domain-containing protein [Desulfotignum sp.]